jgi:hypothetical protein
MKHIASISLCILITLIISACDNNYSSKKDNNYDAIDSVLADLQNLEQNELKNSEAIQNSRESQVIEETTSTVDTESLEYEDNDPSGTYIYEKPGNMGGKQELRITGNTWISKLTLTTGFGESYDDEQAMYSSGTVDGKKLMDETGYVQVGRLWKNANKRWAVDFAGSSGEITLFKE